MNPLTKQLGVKTNRTSFKGSIRRRHHNMELKLWRHVICSLRISESNTISIPDDIRVV
jgi:hypothetical protein